MASVLCVSCARYVVFFWLSLPLQLMAWKDWSPTCQMGRKLLLTTSNHISLHIIIIIIRFVKRQNAKRLPCANLKSLFHRLLGNKWQQIVFFMTTDVTLPHHGHCRHPATLLQWPVITHRTPALYTHNYTRITCHVTYSKHKLTCHWMRTWHSSSKSVSTQCWFQLLNRHKFKCRLW